MNIVTYNLSHRTSEAVSDYRRIEVLFRSDWVSFLLLFMGKIRIKTRLLSCTVAKATDIQWSKMLTVCGTARAQAG